MGKNKVIKNLFIIIILISLLIGCLGWKKVKTLKSNENISFNKVSEEYNRIDNKTFSVLTKENNLGFSKNNIGLVTSADIAEQSCTSLLGDPADKKTPSPAFLLTYAFKVIRYVAIVILVVMSMLDFIESTSSQDKDSVNKAISKTITRIILCVIIFLLPSLLEFILTLLNDHAVNICINA